MARAAVDKVSSHSQFAARVGITFGMASRLCSGDRAASRETLNSIIEGFGLTGKTRVEAVDAWLAGPETFGQWVQAHLYERSDAA